MKKLFTFLATFAMLFSLAACSTAGNTTNESLIDATIKQFKEAEKIKYAFIEDSEFGEVKITEAINNSESTLKEELFNAIFEKEYVEADDAEFNNANVVVILCVENENYEPTMLYVCNDGLVRITVNRDEGTLYTCNADIKTEVETLLREYPELLPQA